MVVVVGVRDAAASHGEVIEWRLSRECRMLVVVVGSGVLASSLVVVSASRLLLMWMLEMVGRDDDESAVVVVRLVSCVNVANQLLAGVG